MQNSNFSLDDMRAEKLFGADCTIAWDFLIALDAPWDALPLIKSWVSKLGIGLSPDEYVKHPDNVWIHKTAVVAPSAFIGSDIIIGADTEVRHCAYMRGPAIIGKNAVVGNSTELKNVILFDEVQVPHFNYIGDSILGYKAHLGAGVITSNVKSDKSLVAVSYEGTNNLTRIKTNLKKFGAIIGDSVEVGCNAVLNPGTVIGADSNIYPLSMVRGFVPAGCIYKSGGEITKKR